MYVCLEKRLEGLTLRILTISLGERMRFSFYAFNFSLKMNM